MLHKRQIRAFKFNVLLSLLMGACILFPLRTLPYENGYQLDILLKGFIFPLLIILLSMKANVIKYHELEDCRLRSKVANIMSYLPGIIYLLALLTSTLQTMTIGMYEGIAMNPFTTVLYGVVLAILLSTIIALLLCTKFINRVVMKADKTKLLALDVSFGMLIVLSILVFYVINGAYHEAFSAEAIYHKGNIVLLIIFVIGFISFFKVFAKVCKVFNENETQIGMNVSEVMNYEPSVETKNAEYRRAFKQIKEEFGAFLIKENNKNTELPQNNESDVQVNQSETLVKE